MTEGPKAKLGGIDALYALLTIAQIAPALIFPLPRSVDYINHLVRLQILTAAPDSLARRYFVPDWRPLANLGLDLLAFPIALIASPAIAMKVVWCLGILGLAGGGWYLHRAFARQTQPAFLLVALMLFNLPVTMGFLNYLLGIGCSLFALGYWMRRQDRMTPARLAAFNLIALATLVCHVAAAGALGVCLCLLYGLGTRRGFWRRLATIACGFILPAAWFLTIILSHPLISNTHHAGSVIFSLKLKILCVMAPVFTTDPNAVLTNLIVLWGISLALLGVALWRRAWAASLPILLWSLLILLLPSNIGDAGFIDARLSLYPALLIACVLSATGAVLPMQRNLGGAIITIACSLAVCLRLGLLLPHWQAFNRDVASFRAIETTFPIGAKVLLAQEVSHPGQSCHNTGLDKWFSNAIATLLVVDRGAFVNTLFADPNLQPLQPRPAWRALYKANAPPLPVWMLLRRNTGAGGAADAPLPPAVLQFFPDDWARDYDFMAIERDSCTKLLQGVANLRLAAESRTYLVYRILHPRAAP